MCQVVRPPVPEPVYVAPPCPSAAARERTRRTVSVWITPAGIAIVDDVLASDHRRPAARLRARRRSGARRVVPYRERERRLRAARASRPAETPARPATVGIGDDSPRPHTAGAHAQRHGRRLAVGSARPGGRASAVRAKLEERACALALTCSVPHIHDRHRQRTLRSQCTEIVALEPGGPSAPRPISARSRAT